MINLSFKKGFDIYIFIFYNKSIKLIHDIVKDMCAPLDFLKNYLRIQFLNYFHILVMLIIFMIILLFKDIFLK